LPFVIYIYMREYISSIYYDLFRPSLINISEIKLNDEIKTIFYTIERIPEYVNIILNENKTTFEHPRNVGISFLISDYYKFPSGLILALTAHIVNKKNDVIYTIYEAYDKTQNSKIADTVFFDTLLFDTNNINYGNRGYVDIRNGYDNLKMAIYTILTDDNIPLWNKTKWDTIILNDIRDKYYFLDLDPII